MKALFIVLIASLFASEFTDIEEYDAKVKWSVGITFGNMDMSAPEFDVLDDDLKINIRKIIKKVLPIVVPKIPKIGPIIAPFLSEEDMEPEMIGYDKDVLADIVMAELDEEYEMDAGFWKKVKNLVKKVAPIVIKKVVPMIPKVGPIIAPFLAEEDEDADDQWSVQVGVTIRWSNEDMFSPEFDHIDDDLKINIGKIIKKVLPIVVPKIPKIGPIIAPFLSEEDMEPEMIDYDKGELADIVLAELSEKYEIDAGFWKKVKKFVKKVAPVVIKKVVPMIPKVGPIIAPFLGEEDSDEMIMNMTNPFAKKIHLRPRPSLRPRPHYRLRPHPKKFKKIIKRTPKPTVEQELDEFKLKNIIKKILPVVVPMIPKVGPIIAPFLGEEDSDEMEVSPEMEDLILWAVADQLIEEGYELDEGFWKKVKAWIKPRIPQIIRTVVPLIPKVGPKIAPIIEPFLAEEDSLPHIRPVCARMCPAVACPPGTRKNSCTCQCVRV